MAYAKAQDLVESSKTRSIHVYGYGIEPDSYYRGITLDKARALLRAGKQAALNRAMGNKYNRPWNIINVTEKLDPTQAWFGIEFETGFSTMADYQRAINYMWQYQPYSAIDREGFGAYSAELTFSPVNADKFLGEKSGIWQLLRYLKKKGINQPTWNRTQMIGTHVNVSTPAFRALRHNDRVLVVDAMNAGFGALGDGERIEFFGRSPYGTGYLQGNGSTTAWVEFKLFNSTSDIATFRGYARVMKRIADAMEYLSVNLPSQASNVTDEMRDVAARAIGGTGRRSTRLNLGIQFNESSKLSGFAEFLRGQDVPLVVTRALTAHWQYDGIYGGRSVIARQQRVSLEAVDRYLASLPQQ